MSTTADAIHARIAPLQEQLQAYPGLWEMFQRCFMNTIETTVQQSPGDTFVITGDVHNFANRNELKAFIESLGGKTAGSVSKSTSYLINNDVTSTSGKNRKAKELAIPILSEDEFLSRFGR